MPVRRGRSWPSTRPRTVCQQSVCSSQQSANSPSTSEAVGQAGRWRLTEGHLCWSAICRLRGWVSHGGAAHQKKPPHQDAWARRRPRRGGGRLRRCADVRRRLFRRCAAHPPGDAARAVPAGRGADREGRAERRDVGRREAPPERSQVAVAATIILNHRRGRTAPYVTEQRFIHRLCTCSSKGMVCNYLLCHKPQAAK